MKPLQHTISIVLLRALSLPARATIARASCIAAVAFGIASSALAQLAMPPALDPTITANFQKIALGDWGESAVAHLFRERGFEFIDMNVNSQGLDGLAFKRDASGALTDVRAVEVKARSAAGDLGLPGNTNNGRQLTSEKLMADLKRAATEHPRPEVRKVAQEALELHTRNTANIKVERHVLTLKDGKYTVYEGATNSRPAGRPVANGSLDKIFSTLSKSSDDGVAASARTNLDYLRSSRASVSKTVASTTIHTQEAVAVTRSASASAARTTSTTLSSQGTRAAGFIYRKPWFPLPPWFPTPLPRWFPTTMYLMPPSIGTGIAGAAGGAATAGVLSTAVMASVSTYSWANGDISDARFQEDLTRACGVGAATGLVTGGILLFTPAAPVVVLVAVGAATASTAEIALDWAMERENEHLIAGEIPLAYGAAAAGNAFNPNAAPGISSDPLTEALARLRASKAPN